MTDTEITVSDLPNGWEWHGGSRGGTHYTTNFGTAYKMGGNLEGKHGLGGYHGQVYWDKGQPHTVIIRPVVRITELGDPEYGYPVATRQFDTEREALNGAIEMVAEL